MGHVTEYGPAKTGEYPRNIYRVPFKRSYVLRDTFKLYTVCSSKRTVFPFSEQIMSRDKYSSMFSCQNRLLLIYAHYITLLLGEKLHFTYIVYHWVYPL